MKNRPQPNKKSQFSHYEEEMIQIWNKENTFEKSLEQNKDKRRFRFYDGPPFTSGPPHYGHIEQGTIKDSIVRYKTMRGYYVPRRAGCDTHGLPIENLVEKELGFANKKAITEFGVDKFNKACRDVVFRHKADFEEMYQRIGRWNDPKQTYATLDDDYIESVWQVFAVIYKKGLVYQGFKSMPYCPRCATPLSNFEVNDGYKDGVPDPSLFVKFKLSGSNEFMLAWTTTPWSLPGNAALAVRPDADYVKIQTSDDEGKSEVLILAEKRVESLNAETFEVLERIRGKDLVGLSYEPLFALSDLPKNDNLYKIWPADFVSIEDGSGVLHVAPAFGEDDLALADANNIPVLSTVDMNGHLNSMVNDQDLVGKFFKKADKTIIEKLTKLDRVYAVETFEHTYPFCWRCETPLIYMAMPSWFVAVSQIRDRLVETGQEVNWVPAAVKQGRFIKWLENARDWAISRNRFWGAPIPVWENVDDSSDRIVVGSIAELRELSGVDGEFDLHRPGIDNVVIKQNGKVYRRIEEVFDCWFESGSMPYGQDHYPFENKAEFDNSFPAEFVAESVEQVHLWFYTLHVLATALFDKPAYKNVIASGLILGEDGRKLSKRLRNYSPPSEFYDEFGVDSLRFFIINSPLTSGSDIRLSRDGLADVNRNVFMTLWNTFSFYKMYTDIDKWKPKEYLALPASQHPLDSWIMARLAETVTETTKQADKYLLVKATDPIREFIDDLSNWYVRRSRRRFWKSENDSDKVAAYETLYFILTNITQLLAPWSPFLSDKIFRELNLHLKDAPQSVHLSDWPQADKIDTSILEQMKVVRQVVNDGLAARAKAEIKVRQPLASATIYTAEQLSNELKTIIAEELNTKKVVVKTATQLKVQLDTKITQTLKNEGLAREVIRNVQQTRKEASLDVENRIALSLHTDSSELSSAISEFSELIKNEVLATKFDHSATKYSFEKSVTIEGMELGISLQKV